MRLPRPVLRAAARLKPVLPPTAYPVVASLRSLAGNGPLVGLPGFTRVLVLAPHPDDEAIGCAGTISQLSRAGATVTVVFLTDGDATIGATSDQTTTASRRRDEAEAACRICGANARFLGHPDQALVTVVDELATQVHDLVTELDAEAVFVPWFLDGHPDHTAANRALVAADLPPTTEVWGCETWTSLPLNRLVDITDVIDLKEKAVAAHATAHQAFDVGAMLGLNRWRSVHGLMGQGWAEAFLAAPFPTYAELAAAAWA
jgi:LmbE family N-acetylglucosaminyl deacetylase